MKIDILERSMKEEDEGYERVQMLGGASTCYQGKKMLHMRPLLWVGEDHL